MDITCTCNSDLLCYPHSWSNPSFCSIIISDLWTLITNARPAEVGFSNHVTILHIPLEDLLI